RPQFAGIRFDPNRVCGSLVVMSAVASVNDGLGKPSRQISTLLSQDEDAVRLRKKPIEVRLATTSFGHGDRNTNEIAAEGQLRPLPTIHRNPCRCCRRPIARARDAEYDRLLPVAFEC